MPMHLGIHIIKTQFQRPVAVLLGVVWTLAALLSAAALYTVAGQSPKAPAAELRAAQRAARAAPSSDAHRKKSEQTLEETSAQAPSRSTMPLERGRAISKDKLD